MDDPIKQKIQSLCPDVLVQIDDDEYPTFKELPITLAVVLRAINKAKATPLVVDTHGCFMELYDNRFIASQSPHWNLELDNYDAQSQETKDFIGSLLGV